MATRAATVHSEAFPGRTSARTCQLVVVEGPDTGRAIRLGREARTVGTDPTCDLVLTDTRVSRRHLEVTESSDGQYAVRDLGSRNGTLYEGSKVESAHVGAGATLKLGRTFVRIVPGASVIDVPPSASRRFGELVGESLAMREVFAVLELAAQSDVTVLLEGETGTGKELAARGIHDASARRRGPFVAVDCGALPETLLESELFGHVRGAFTGAATSRDGAFVRAGGGTLFLDELGSVSAAVQARLLRALEARSVRPVGSDVERALDVRVIAASRDDLSTRIAEGRFRSDLFYRLSVVRVVMPPLRTRREDLAPTVAELLRRRGFTGDDVTGAPLERLRAHDWPGNVRELRNVIDRAVALSPGVHAFAGLRLAVTAAEAAGTVEGLQVRTDATFADAKQSVMDAFERRYLTELMARANGNLSAASRLADVDRKHLRGLLVRHGIVPAKR